MKKRKKIPLRMCLGCRTRQEKKVMLRIVGTQDGSLEIDPTGKKSGRGTYVCPTRECLALLNRKYLAAALKMELPEEDVAQLKKSLEELVESS